MIRQNLVYKSTRYVIIDLIGDILFWPIWWYTRGLINTAFYCLATIRGQEERLGVTIWIKNIFTPMFGQYDIEGRIISFFARLIQIIARSIYLFVWALLTMMLLVAWIFLPVIFAYFTWQNFLTLVTQ